MLSIVVIIVDVVQYHGFSELLGSAVTAVNVCRNRFNLPTGPLWMAI